VWFAVTGVATGVAMVMSSLNALTVKTTTMALLILLHLACSSSNMTTTTKSPTNSLVIVSLPSYFSSTEGRHLFVDAFLVGSTCVQFVRPYAQRHHLYGTSSVSQSTDAHLIIDQLNVSFWNQAADPAKWTPLHPSMRGNGSLDLFCVSSSNPLLSPSGTSYGSSTAINISIAYKQEPTQTLVVSTPRELYSDPGNRATSTVNVSMGVLAGSDKDVLRLRAFVEHQSA
jgi:hypothetical protein